MNSIKEEALNLHSQGYNCCQSVCIAYADKLNIDKDILFKLSEGFGAGMGNLQGSCGALSAAVMIAGLINSGGIDAQRRTKAKTYRLVAEINKEFVEKAGSMYCKDIKGVGTGKVLRSCDGCIEDACDIIDNLLLTDDK